jgi:hypothetical protein
MAYRDYCRAGGKKPSNLLIDSTSAQSMENS